MKNQEMGVCGPRLDSIVLLRPPYEQLFVDGNLNIQLLNDLLWKAGLTQSPVELRNTIDAMNAVIASLKSKYKWITFNQLGED